MLSPSTRNALLTNVARQASDTADTETTVVKRKVANHAYLDAAGAVVEDEKEATGIRYTLLALPDQPFEWQSGLGAGESNTMLAVFGAKTLATNETSAARNNTKGEASPMEQITAVRERFALVASGEWVDRTGGAGAKVDLDALAEAIVQQVESEGKLPDGTDAGAYKAKVRQKLDDDKVWARKSRTHSGVSARYAQIVGRTQATTDDLLAI